MLRIIPNRGVCVPAPPIGVPGGACATPAKYSSRLRRVSSIVGDLKLTDIEDGDVADITVSGPLLRRYKDNLAAYRASIHEFCTRRGVTYLFTSNQVPFDRLVMTYLRQRGLVR